LNVYGEYCEIINQFHKESDRAGGAEPEEGKKQPVSIEKYEIDCSISKSLTISAACKMQLRSQRDGQEWISLYLAGYTFTPLEVDSAVWGNGKSTEFYKDKENTALWVKCPQALANDQLCTLSVFYRGSILDKYYNWVYVKTSISWYPRGEYKSKALFDVTFHYPSRYSFVSVGKNTYTQNEGEMTTSRWVTIKPVRNYTFNLGFFKEYKMNEKGVPPVTILLNETARKDYQMDVMASGGFLNTGRDMKKQVGADIVNSIVFLSEGLRPVPGGRIHCLREPIVRAGKPFQEWSTYRPRPFKIPVMRDSTRYCGPMKWPINGGATEWITAPITTNGCPRAWRSFPDSGICRRF